MPQRKGNPPLFQVLAHLLKNRKLLLCKGNGFFIVLIGTGKMGKNPVDIQVGAAAGGLNFIQSLWACAVKSKAAHTGVYLNVTLHSNPLQGGLLLKLAGVFR